MATPLHHRLTAAAVLAAVAALGLALVTLGGLLRFGPAALALPAALVAGALLLRRPAVALGLLIAIAVAAEAGPEAITHTSRLYGRVVPLLSAFDIAYFATAAVVLVDCARRRTTPRLPLVLTGPLLVLAAASAMGAVNGSAAGSTPQVIFATVLVLGYLFVTPFLVVAVLSTPGQVRRVLAGLAILIGVKALVGVLAVLAGVAAPVLGATSITYYEPTANWLIVVMLMVIAGAFLRGVRLPGWTTWMWPLLLLALVLSYRRSFWVMTVLAVLVILVLGASRLQRRFAVPAALLVAGLIAVALSTGVGANLQGPVVDRAKALSPSEIAASSDDQYRVQERHNVLASVERHPLAGLGLGVPWIAYEPIAAGSEEAKQYTHVAVLWFWMKLGVLGILAYLGIVLGGALMGYRVFRRHPDPQLGVVGLASCACLLSLVVGEGTATFTGTDPRFTVVLGAHLGLLAVLHRQARSTAPYIRPTP